MFEEPSEDICEFIKTKWQKISRHIQIKMSLFVSQICKANNCCIGRWDKYSSDLIIEISGPFDQSDQPDQINPRVDYIYNDSPINIENYSLCAGVDRLYTEEIETYNMSNIKQKKKIVYTPDSTSSSDCSENDSYTDYSSTEMSSSISSDELYSDTRKIDKNNAYIDCSNNETKTMEVNDNQPTDSDKFIRNLKNNLLVLAELEEGYKLWIDEETQRLYIDSTIGQAITRRLYGQGKAKTLEFIKRMIDTAELQATPEYTDLLDKAKQGVKNITATYKKSAWFGKYPEVDELEKIIDEKGWNRDSGEC
jgi:hypothetical protein